MRSLLSQEHLLITFTLLFGLLSKNGLAISRLSVEKNCHQEDEIISITFEQDQNPMVDQNWIGIYWDDDGIVNDTSADPLLWLWTCGSQTCHETMNSGAVTFGAENITTNHLLTWPLMPGKYLSVLAHDYPTRRTTFAMSETITVSDACLPEQNSSNNSATTTAPPNDSISIFVNEGCHEVNSNISISFENDNPSIEDWIGIYWANEEHNNYLSEPLMWTWTCGSQTCNSINGNDTVVFGERPSGNDLLEWPLIPGNYVAILAHNIQSRQVALAMSEPFSVVGACLSSQVRAGITPTNLEASSNVSTLRSSMVLDQLSSPTIGRNDKTLPGDSSDSQKFTHIELDKKCYKLNTTIEMVFTSAFQKHYNWVGLYPSNLGLILDTPPPAWYGLCDRSSCSETHVNLSSSSDAKLSLEKGSYTAVLGISKKANRPALIFAETSMFEIADECFALSHHNPQK